MNMHEYAITQNIIDLAVEEAKKNDAKIIKNITLVIGELTSIIDESVQMYFDLLAEETIAKDAKLIFKNIKAQLRCNKCYKTFERQKSSFNCPYCEGLGRLTDIGKEFYIESIEVE